jgi:transposase
MEDVLDLYAEADERYFPVVCFDQCPIQLVSEVRQPIAALPGQRRRYDYHYRREGTANLFIAFCPRQGWRPSTVTDRRPKRDFALQMKALVDVHFPQALKIRLVLDNLNIHVASALYQPFEATEARRILRRLEVHFTPIHASWLNMVELELAVLSGQCLKRRIDSLHLLRHEIGVGQAERNLMQATVKWRFTCEKARLNLRLYPH